MKILVATTSFPPALGGAQLHTHRLVAELQRRHEVIVAAQWSSQRTDWLLGTTLRAPTATRLYEVEGVAVQQLAWSVREKLSLLPHVVGYYAWQDLAIRSISRRLSRHLEPLAAGVDLVHAVRVGREPLAFASALLARRHGVPFLLTPNHHPRWRGYWYRNYARLYRSADGLIALTRAERRALVELGAAEEAITVAGIGPIVAPTSDGARFRVRHGVPGRMVLFLGQKFRYKNTAALLAAAPFVWREAGDTTFVFVGPRTDHSRRLFRPPLDRRVVEIGAVGLQEKTDALAACDLLCLPSTQESFGGVFVEAWTLGKPVIGARIPAVAEVIDDGVDGLLANPEPADLSRCILRLLNDPDLASRLGASGREKARGRYSWSRIAGIVEDAYGKACEEARRRRRPPELPC
jgi:glycosyltransferase involved in cell wall biosynthesis